MPPKPTGPPSWRAALRRGASWTRDRFPLSAAGLALLALAAGSAWFGGVRRLDLILLTGSLLLAGLLAFLLLSTVAAALWLRHRLRRQPPPAALEGSCGVWLDTGRGVALPAWLPYLDLRVEWVAPPGLEARAGTGGREEILGRRRCQVDQVRRRLTLGDILGLTGLSWELREPCALRLLPARAPLRRTELLRGLRRGEDQYDPFGEPAGDRVDLRRYGQGDPMRMILWKVYARTRKLAVRTPERAVEAAPRVCAYLPAAAGDEAAARLARTVLEEGLLGRAWRFGADVSEDAETLLPALHALARSGSAEPGRPGGLDAFLRRAGRDGFGSCVLFLPPERGPWLPAVREALAASPLRVQVLLAFEGWAAERPPLWRRALWRPEPGDATQARAARLLELLGALTLPGCAFTLVDTASGTVLEDPEAFLVRRARGEGGKAA